jgi:hypothetical protein
MARHGPHGADVLECRGRVVQINYSRSQEIEREKPRGGPQPNGTPIPCAHEPARASAESRPTTAASAPRAAPIILAPQSPHPSASPPLSHRNAAGGAAPVLYPVLAPLARTLADLSPPHAHANDGQVRTRARARGACRARLFLS